MKRKFVSILHNKGTRFLLLAVFLWLSSAASAKAQTYEAFVEKRVSQIRGEVNAINRNAAKYTKKSKNVEGISLEGTEATYHFSGKNLQKITAKMYGETYNAIAELYYQSGELLFAFVQRNEYDTQIGLDKPPKVVRTLEQRFYFSSANELIRMLVGAKEIKRGDERYSELKDEVTSLSTKLRNS